MPPNWSLRCRAATINRFIDISSRPYIGLGTRPRGWPCWTSWASFVSILICAYSWRVLSLPYPSFSTTVPKRGVALFWVSWEWQWRYHYQKEGPLLPVWTGYDISIQYRVTALRNNWFNISAYRYCSTTVDDVYVFSLEYDQKARGWWVGTQLLYV